MPEWKDMTILLSSIPFGETGMLVSVLSKNNGRYKSFVHGGNSVKKRSIFQKGNICNAEWKARISDQMGSIKLELVSSTATNFFNHPIQLTALSAVCEISDYILPEREPNQNIFIATLNLFELLKLSNGLNFDWVKGYVKWEIGLLSELGFSLKLQECAVNGKRENLSFVSPKTGRAVSYNEGLPYKDKLLVLPKFLGGNNNSTCLISDLILGLNLTKYFLNFNFYNNNSISPSRIRLEKQLQKKIIQA